MRARKTVMGSHPAVPGKPRWPGGDLLAEPSRGRAETSLRRLTLGPLLQGGGCQGGHGQLRWSRG